MNKFVAICVTDKDSDVTKLTKGKEYEVMSNDSDFVKAVNDVGDPKMYPASYFKIKSEVEIQKFINIPLELEIAIDTLNKYGITLDVNGKEVSLIGSTTLNIGEPFIKGYCQQRKEMGIACYDKCDECKFIDEERRS